MASIADHVEAGIDSLSAVEFRGKISSEFRAVRLPSTLMFDHPTLKLVGGDWNIFDFSRFLLGID